MLLDARLRGHDNKNFLLDARAGVLHELRPSREFALDDGGELVRRICRRLERLARQRFQARTDN